MQKRYPHLSISAPGRVFIDGEPIGSVVSVQTVWGEMWGFQIEGRNMAPYYVEGDRWVAARACAVAHFRLSKDRARRSADEQSA